MVKRPILAPARRSVQGTLPPSILSDSPGESVRLVGIFVPLALLTGVGAVSLVTTVSGLSRLRNLPKLVVVGFLIICLSARVLCAEWRFEAHWRDPNLTRDNAQGYWPTFAHYYSTKYVDFLMMLQRIDQPTYIPLETADSPMGVWCLHANAFATVKTLGITIHWQHYRIYL